MGFVPVAGTADSSCFHFATLSVRRRNDKRWGLRSGVGTTRCRGRSSFAQVWAVTNDVAIHRSNSLKFCHSERAGFSPESLP
jgi:hypothetical protein